MTEFETRKKGRQTRLGVLIFVLEGWELKRISSLLKTHPKSLEYHVAKLRRHHRTHSFARIGARVLYGINC